MWDLNPQTVKSQYPKYCLCAIRVIGHNLEDGIRTHKQNILSILGMPFPALPSTPDQIRTGTLSLESGLKPDVSSNFTTGACYVFL